MENGRIIEKKDIFFTKEDMVLSFENYIRECEEDGRISKAIKKQKLKLAEEFYEKLKEHSIPMLNGRWFYKYICDDSGYELRMCMAESINIGGIKVSEEYTLIKAECNYLTVEEFAELHDVSDVTVRQWIRRGKLRNARKTGGEWLISEMTEKPSKGYKDVEYTLLDNDIKIGEFPIASYCNAISIAQDASKSKFICRFTNDKTGFFKELEMLKRDVESLELALISSGKVIAKTIEKPEPDIAEEYEDDIAEKNENPIEFERKIYDE